MHVHTCTFAAADPFKTPSLNAHRWGVPGVQKGCTRVTPEKGHMHERVFAILFFFSFLEAIPISLLRALQDKLGDGSVIIPSRICTRCRLCIRVLRIFPPFFPLPFSPFLLHIYNLISFIYI